MKIEWGYAMQPKIIKKSDLKHWLNDLTQDYPLIAPIKKGDTYDFQVIDDVEKIAFECDRTRMSAKNLFFIPEERLWIASMSNGSPVYIEAEKEKKILFGVRPCDISALNLFDEVFTKDYFDPYYSNQRESIITIGIRCREKCEHGFCDTMKSYNPLNGYDILLTDLDQEKYLVEIGTLKGNDIIDFDYFQDVTEADISLSKKVFIEIEETFDNDDTIIGLRANMDFKVPQELLDEYGDICLSCGQCSFVCPTCWCFNVKDEVGADDGDFGNLDKVARTRNWTSCLYKEYHSISGQPPHVFKKTTSSRLEAYYNHKLRGVLEKFGKFGCVGCGRCFQSCPVGINPKVTVNSIMEVKQ